MSALLTAAGPAHLPPAVAMHGEECSVLWVVEREFRFGPASAREQAATVSAQSATAGTTSQMFIHGETERAARTVPATREMHDRASLELPGLPPSGRESSLTA